MILRSLCLAACALICSCYVHISLGEHQNIELGEYGEVHISGHEPAIALAPPSYIFVWRGYVYGASGFGEEARALIKGLRDVGVDVRIEPLDQYPCSIATPEENKFYRSIEVDTKTLVPRKRNKDPKAPIIVALHHHMPSYVEAAPWADYNIGRTMWEMEYTPPEWMGPCRAMDEIWVPTEFNKDNFHTAGLPLEQIHVIGESIDEHYEAAAREEVEQGARKKKTKKLKFNLPALQKFNFVSVFNWNYRKGWDILVEAFAREFPPRAESSVGLVLKVFSTFGRDVEEFKQDIVRVLVGKGVLNPGDQMPSNIMFISEGITTPNMPVFYRSFDSFVLPTRAEGWGRATMEAMSCGVPVVTTMYSGQAAFVTTKNAFAVPYTMVPVSREAIEEYSYFEGGSWADPSVPELRKMMRRVIDKPKEAQKKARQAQEDILEQFTKRRLGEAMKERLDHIVSTIPAPKRRP